MTESKEGNALKKHWTSLKELLMTSFGKLWTSKIIMTMFDYKMQTFLYSTGSLQLTPYSYVQTALAALIPQRPGCRVPLCWPSFLLLETPQQTSVWLIHCHPGSFLHTCPLRCWSLGLPGSHVATEAYTHFLPPSVCSLGVTGKPGAIISVES